MLRLIDRRMHEPEDMQATEGQWQCDMGLLYRNRYNDKGGIMAKTTRVAIAHSDQDLGKPGDCAREQFVRVRAMVKQVVDGSVGGMQNIVQRGQTVLIKVNCVVPSPPDAGFTTDPRMLEALVELVKEQNPAKIQLGERSAQGGDTLYAMEVCGIKAVAARTGAELVAFEHVPFDMFTLPEPTAFRTFPVPRPVRDADVYIGLPKFKTHTHTRLTCALKLQIGNLPDYEWMVASHGDDIWQKIVNLTKAAKPKWVLVDSLWACQGNGPFSAYPEDVIRDYNTILAGADPVAVDTVCEALADWPNPGSIPYLQLAAAQGLGTNRLDDIEIVGVPIGKAKRSFKMPDNNLLGVFPNINVIMGAACEPGCRALLRIQLDPLYQEGTLAKLKRPVTVFVGRQSEPLVRDVEGDVVVYGDCAKDMCAIYKTATFFGSRPDYPGCLPVYSNLEGGMLDHIRSLVG